MKKIIMLLVIVMGLLFTSAISKDQQCKQLMASSVNKELTMPSMGTSLVCWYCQCTVCGWNGNLYKCYGSFGGNPCGGWNCPYHGTTLKTVVMSCTAGMCDIH